MLIDYLYSLENIVDLCEKFEERVVKSVFANGTKNQSEMTNFCWTRSYRDQFSPIKSCVYLCGILKLPSLKKYERSLEDATSSLEEPRDADVLSSFRLCFNLIKSCFKVAREEILEFCSSFDDGEKERINEAIHNFFEGCNYSCVAMAVSAVESRLLKLINLACPDSKAELEGRTLGQLIYEYANNKVKYQNIVPEKHEPLLELCNTYRIFSVHPKKHKIKGTIANSILCLAIEFLTDKETKLEIVREKLAASS